MAKKDTIGEPADRGRETVEPSDFRVDDRRHWSREEREADDEPDGEVGPRKPTLIDEYRGRAESAEAKLHEYIAAFKTHQEEQDSFRERMGRDVERRVELQFGDLIGELLQAIDDLDLALAHVDGVPEAEPLATGVALARDRFLSTLERHGVQKISPENLPFDPNDAEALRMDPVGSRELDGIVTEVVRPGYRLGDRVVRPAAVAVGRYDEAGSR